MKHNHIRYSVIVPVYNGADTLIHLWERTVAVFTSLNQPFEVIFVSDASPDNSWSVLQALKKQYPDAPITAILLARNFGQHQAILCGLQYAKGDYIITLDDDLQTPPESIPALIAQQQSTHAPVVYGIYSQKQHRFWRNLASKWAKKIFGYGSHHRDGSSFRLLTRGMVNMLLQHQQPIIYIDNLLLFYTQHIEVVTVPHLPRVAGKSGYSLCKLLQLMQRLIFLYSDIPIRVLGYIVLFLTISSFCGVAAALWYRTPIVALAAVVICCHTLLVFALYIAINYAKLHLDLANRKPPYVVKTIL